MSRSGADALVGALERAGTEIVFGVPGTQTVGVFEALRTSRIRTVLTTSETGAAFMAGGLARITKSPGVLLTIPGPGFVWALPGIAEARLDSVPLLHISGRATRIPGRHGQQELDQSAIARSLVKAILELDEPSRFETVVTEGMALARGGEPGPVLLQVAAEALAAPSMSTMPHTNSAAPASVDFQPVLARLKAARRPLFLVGRGAVPHAAMLLALVERLQIPVICTPSARGVVPEDHPLALGFDPLRSDVTPVNELLDQADLVVGIGAKLGHSGSAGFQLRLPRERLVRVDTSIENLQANYLASLSVNADSGAVLAALSDGLTTRSAWSTGEVQQWHARVLGRAPFSLEPKVGGSGAGDASGFFGELRGALPREAILVLDSGMHQILARRYFPVLAPDGMQLPSDLQSMGFAIPTAVGACLAVPRRPVVAIVGDGGFAMSSSELLTAVRERVRLVVIVFADGFLGQIRRQQLIEYGTPFAVGLGSFDLAAWAEAIGAKAIRAPASIGQAVALALEGEGLTVIVIPVGDTAAARLQAVKTVLKHQAQRMLGRRIIEGIKALLGRGA